MDNLGLANVTVIERLSSLSILYSVSFKRDTVWLEIFEAKKVRCFRGFRVNLEFFILEIKYINPCYINCM